MADMTEARKMWGGLHTAWEDLPSELEGENPLWKRECCAVTFFLELKGEVLYELVAECGGEVCVEEEFAAEDLEKAKNICDGIIGEFFQTAFETWFGRRADFSRPKDEIRIRQAFIFPEPSDRFGQVVHSIMAVGDDGKLYYFSGTMWEPRSMKVG